MADMIPRAEADARVAAAFEAAAMNCELSAKGEVGRERALLLAHAAWFRGRAPDDTRAAFDQMISDAVNEATRLTVPIAALDAMLAEARRDAVETARQAVWDKLDGSQLAEQLCDAIDAAIRAEAEAEE